MVGREAHTDLGRLFNEGTDAGLTDGRLLERFVERGDEAAFASLVARHGAMVLGVCRRWLRDPHDVEDAFQAVFLVLVRRSGSVRDGDRLAAWLYGVAYRVSARARAAASQRQGRERPGLGVEALAVVADRDRTREELLLGLDEEVARLPEPSRAVIVLCDLGGLTHEEASRRLACPVGTVKSRLASARTRLRRRLTVRGLAPALALTGLGRFAESASAITLPPPRRWWRAAFTSWRRTWPPRRGALAWGWFRRRSPPWSKENLRWCRCSRGSRLWQGSCSFWEEDSRPSASRGRRPVRSRWGPLRPTSRDLVENPARRRRIRVRRRTAPSHWLGTPLPTSPWNWRIQGSRRETATSRRLGCKGRT